MVANNEATKDIEAFERLEKDKTVYLPLWQELGDFGYPGSANFTRYLTKGENRRRPLFDGTAERCNEIFASSMLGLIANPASKWINFQTADPALMDDREVQLFIDEAQTKVLAVFNNPYTKFYDNLFVCLQMMGAYGTTCLFVDEDADNVAKFRAESPKGLNFTEDFSGNTEDVYFCRKFKIGVLRDKAANENWDIPKEILDKQDEEEVDVLRVIKKNPKWDRKKLGKTFARYLSKYYLKAEKKLINDGFFNTLPAPVGRWGRLDGEKWGDSCMRVALSEIKMLNASQRGVMVGMEKQLRPTLAIASEAKFGKFNDSAGAINVGRGNMRDAVTQIQTTGNVPLVVEWNEQIRQTIRQSFYIDIFQMPDGVARTATESQIINAEKLRSLAPRASRVQSDLLGPAAERVLYMLIQQGKLKVPKALAGQELRVIYLSPLAQAQRQVDANNILQFLNDLTVVAQIKPEVLDIIDGDAIGKEMADIRGIPEKILLPKDKLEAKREQAAQQQQAATALAATQQVAEIGKTAAQTEAQA